MSDETEARIVPDDGIKNQFGRGAFYRQDVLGSKKVRTASVLALASAIIPLILTGSPEPEHDRKSTLGFTGDLRPGESVYLPSHESVQADITKQDADKLKKGGGSGRPKERFKGPQLVSRPGGGKIPPGIMVQAVLVSGASNGPVKAQLKEPVTLNGETLLEEGIVLVGQGSSTEDRLLIHFTNAVLKDGTVQPIDAQAADYEDKIAGLNGSKVGHYALKLAAAVGLNFVTGMSEGLQDTRVQNGVAYKKPSLKNSLYNGTAMAASEEAQDILNSAKSRQPVIEVPAGTSIYVLF